VSVIARGNDGKATPQAPPMRVESAAVKDVKEITHEGRTLSLFVHKTEYERATFDVSFPDKTTQMVRVKTGETRDVMPEAQNIGVRIEVHECR